MLKQGVGAAVPPFRVMDVVRRANQRALTQPPGAARILRMEVGQPATGLPAGAARAVAAALTGGDPIGYTEALGLLSLRERIAAHILDWYGATIPTSRIAITTGASGAFPLAFLSALHPGDTIALAAPYYPPYVNIATALGMKCQLLPCGPETGFQPTVDMLRQLDPQPDAVLVASPANPTGSMLAPTDLAALATYCHTAGIRLISDEIYHGLTYGKPAASAAQFSESAIIINSFSKYFSMTGWRVGWLVLPEDLIRLTERISQNFFICAPHISQLAAEAAFACHDELQSNRARYAAARQKLLTGLPQAVFDAFSPPDGAFYVYLDTSRHAPDSATFCTRLLEEAGIAATTGLDFDPVHGGNFFRLSYCAPLADVEEAISRLQALVM